MIIEKCLYCGATELTFVAERSDHIEILECQNCGLMMTKKLPGRAEDLYTAEYFEKKTDDKQGYTNYLSSPIADMLGKFAFTDLLNDRLKKHLDIGCADGSLIEIFQANGYESSGLEISSEAVEIAQKKGLDVRQSDLNELPRKIDIVTAFDLIEHLKTPKTVFSEIYSALNKNGLFVFSTLDVTKKDNSDYWFNNSLEHYIYFNKKNLTKILDDFFGPNNHVIVEINMDGIPELWGFAKRGSLSAHQKLIAKVISDRTYPQDEKDAYLLSLFYNQISDFTASREIIKKFSQKWPETVRRLAVFFFEYHQGHFENAVVNANQQRGIIPTREGIFWQAHSFASNEILRINEEKLGKDYVSEIISLREQLFALKSEITSMKSSRVLGRIIKARNYAGEARHHLTATPHKIRLYIAPRIPGPARRFIKGQAKRVLKSVNTTYDSRTLEIKYVANKRWSNNPLVSVVIPYYNRAKTIDDTMLSLQSQTFKGFEVIIVDDGSSEELSQYKLKELRNSILTPRIIHQKNQGVAAARNNGISKAKGKYIICLDSDDILEPTYIEKATVLLEANPDDALVTTHQKIFGVTEEDYKNNPYNPRKLLKDNMVITAAEFRKEAWSVAGGYKGGIGYEDWEFWINLSEHGFWGKLIPEALFRYRTAVKSRFVEDKDVHWSNLKRLRSLHPDYRKNVLRLQRDQRFKHMIKPESAFINLSSDEDYSHGGGNKLPQVLITVPWLAFGGAETLIYNYCREIKDKVGISYITGIRAEHDWEYKFREISENIYHLPNLMEEGLYLEFISNYIKTRGIDILHIIHNGFTFEMLAELKHRHPALKVVLTLFNDRVEYFDQSVAVKDYIDLFATDNNKVHSHYLAELEEAKVTDIIPNGIDCDNEYNPELFDKTKEREALEIRKDQKAIFFIGRLSEEKNPDVFIKVAEKVLAVRDDVKFFVIGDGVMRPEIERMISNINSNNLKYLGYQSEIARYLSAADIFVLPSSIEGFPLSILEAMAMKVAIVASDVGAISEVLDKGQAGKVITPGSADEATTTILEMIADDKKLNSMKISGRKTVEKEFSTKRLGENYTNLYRKAMKH